MGCCYSSHSDLETLNTAIFREKNKVRNQINRRSRKGLFSVAKTEKQEVKKLTSSFRSNMMDSWNQKIREVERKRREKVIKLRGDQE